MWVSWAVRTITDHEGNVTEILCIGNDITDRKRAEEELRRSEESLAKAQQIAKMGSWEMDLTTETGPWSAGMFLLTGFDPSAGTPDFRKEFMERVHPEDRRSLADHTALMWRADQPDNIEFRWESDRRTGEAFLQRVEPIHDADGRVSRLGGYYPGCHRAQACRGGTPVSGTRCYEK